MTAQAGNGSASFVTENDNMNPIVIEALRKATEPSFTDGKAIFNKKVNFSFEVPSCIGTAFRHSVTTYFAIMNEKDFDGLDLELKFEQTSFKFANSEFVGIDGDMIFKLAAKKYLQEQETEEKSPDELISLKYQVLCKKTAYFGQLK